MKTFKEYFGNRVIHNQPNVDPWAMISEDDYNAIVQEAKDEFRKVIESPKEWIELSTSCHCRACNPNYRLMIACDQCGNKRCPHAENHEFICTNSNEPNQIGTLEPDKERTDAAKECEKANGMNTEPKADK